jgi:hypothetical protein
MASLTADREVTEADLGHSEHDRSIGEQKAKVIHGLVVSENAVFRAQSVRARIADKDDGTLVTRQTER